jgi:uncharacterized Zn-finger protein
MSDPEKSPMTQAAAQTTPVQPVIKVSRKDLPLSCPRPEDALWNMHPRVYLPIAAGGEAVCPYCGARYAIEC